MSQATAEDPLQPLRDDAARRVMGWTLAPRPWAYSVVAMAWHAPDGVPIMTQFSWRPDESDAQSAQLLDRMSALGFDYCIRGSDAEIEVSFSRGATRGRAASRDGRRLALLLAALDASTSTRPAGGGLPEAC